MSNLENLEENLCSAFWKQDFKNEFLDVVFHVDGKELFAHGNVLAAASPVFKKQLLQNRSNGNGPIQIDDYSYDEFFEFIGMIYYFGVYDYHSMKKETFYAIIELANIYEIDEIEEHAGLQLVDCDGFEAYSRNQDLTNDNIKEIFEKIEFAHKYKILLRGFKNWNFHKECLENHFDDLIEYNDFVNLDKSAIKAFVVYVNDNSDDGHEELCEAVYKWGEYQAMITVEMPEKEKNQLIFHYINDILPLLKFKKMCMDFLYEFVVAKGLLTIDEANEYKTIKLTLTSNKKTLVGSLVDDYGILEFIQSHRKEKLIDRGSNQRCFWNEKFNQPSTPSTVEKMKSCEWYLAFDRNGKLNLKHHTLINKRSGDYIIAEMKKKENSNDFILDENYAVYATASR